MTLTTYRSGGSLSPFVNLDYILVYRSYRSLKYDSAAAFFLSFFLSFFSFHSLFTGHCWGCVPLPGTFFIDTLDIKSDIVEYFLSRLLDARVCRRKEEKEKELKKKKLFSLVFILAHKLAEESDCASLYYKPNAGDMMAVFLVLWPTRLQVFLKTWRKKEFLACLPFSHWIGATAEKFFNPLLKRPCNNSKFLR